MEAKPRNNYARLPWEIRSRILGMLHDGAEYEDIRNDAAVSAELKAKNLKLHGTTFQAIRRSAEYRDYVHVQPKIPPRKKRRRSRGPCSKTTTPSEV